MNLTPVEIAADVVAVSLALSKLLGALQPTWARMPRWLAVALPVIVMDLPHVAAAFGVVATGADLTTAVLASVAMLLPGVAEAEAAAEAEPAKSVAELPPATTTNPTS